MQPPRRRVAPARAVQWFAWLVIVLGSLSILQRCYEFTKVSSNDAHLEQQQHDMRLIRGAIRRTGYEEHPLEADTAAKTTVVGQDTPSMAAIEVEATTEPTGEETEAPVTTQATVSPTPSPTENETTTSPTPSKEAKEPIVPIVQLTEGSQTPLVNVTVEPKSTETSPKKMTMKIIKATSTLVKLSPAQLAKQQEQCYNEVDLGLIERIPESTAVVCPVAFDDDANATASPLSDALVQPSSTKRSRITLIKTVDGLRATIFSELALDLRQVRIHRPIKTMAQDGGQHDPRFEFLPSIVYCACDELDPYLKQHKDASYRVWENMFGGFPSADHSSTLCAGPTAETIDTVFPEDDEDTNIVRLTGKTVVIARKDDHNPFFQLSNAMNVWLLLRALEWDPQDVRVVYLDGGYPSPVDMLQERLLSPKQNLVRGNDLMGKRVYFQGDVLLAPYETFGPMMQHLDDAQPCQDSTLFHLFRQQALNALEIISPSENDGEEKEQIVVTIISRRPYQGRKIQRVWRNEAEVVEKLQVHYTSFDGVPIVIQSIDFVDLPLKEQIRIMLESDVVISMHGAGLVNVLWTRPQTLVLEIFPKQRKRWGYRNLCQYLGCEWHDFRGGKDIPTGGQDVNANDKVIPYEEWQAFFDPLFREFAGKLVPTTPVPPEATTSVAPGQDDQEPVLVVPDT
ncbi:hypothetical protein Poli38472_010845 [Pythium oligandrum]|uniref:Glycosyltransferase 61 catalytic domain-containing protein n=1 Tax=Pythium oligandrum TaxID=41045 RepID=A0A8K1CGL3_PYTOL|nr:hypothetical protein Poli38472_010845 [Pythium oligandrum]|eukprot:TMW61782.1 hypothetical protein Poli38472_010845 [Pythium oligandrum]